MPSVWLRGVPRNHGVSNFLCLLCLLRFALLLPKVLNCALCARSIFLQDKVFHHLHPVRLSVESAGRTGWLIVRPRLFEGCPPGDTLTRPARCIICTQGWSGFPRLGSFWKFVLRSGLESSPLLEYRDLGCDVRGWVLDVCGFVRSGPVYRSGMVRRNHLSAVGRVYHRRTRLSV